jgi:hypothetical protein
MKPTMMVMAAVVEMGNAMEICQLAFTMAKNLTPRSHHAWMESYTRQHGQLVIVVEANLKHQPQ